MPNVSLMQLCRSYLKKVICPNLFVKTKKPILEVFGKCLAYIPPYCLAVLFFVLVGTRLTLPLSEP